ncbi:MAG: acyl dehydratase [Acidimicrobiales bacterium]|nr:acyl dehydratase [Acidimicrobiales bacterium]
MLGWSLRGRRWRGAAEVNTAPVTVLDGLDAVRAAVGRHLGFSGWIMVTQEQVDRFAGATGDRRWIDVDVEPTTAGPTIAESPPGGPIAPEHLTLALSNLFLPQIVDVRGFSLGVNYGMEKVRFPTPVPVGSRLRGGATLLAVTDIPGGVQTIMRISIELEGSLDSVCVIDSVSRYLA